MLRELHISNLAVIADARIELSSGLNCFTGATGAGKSLVIGAVELLLGLRSPGEMLRPGEEEGRVSGVFELHDAGTLRRIEEATDVNVSADAGELLITRRLYSSGRTSVSLNGQPITLSMLKVVAENLVDVHGQHDHQYLLKPANQIEVLDQFANLEALREEYGAAYAALGKARQLLRELTASRALRDQQLELYRFQAAEIDAAELVVGEFEELGTRSLVLGNLEKLKKDATVVHDALYASDGSLLERLKMMGAIVGEMAILDVGVKAPADALRDATIALQEIAYDIGRYLDRLDLDPGEMAQIEDRLNTLNRILDKYGGQTDAVIQYRAELAAKIGDIEKAGDDLAGLMGSLAPLRVVLEKVGRQLSARRRAAAGSLSPRIEAALAELGMEKAKFSIALCDAPMDDGLPATPSGFDTIEFMARTNPGQLEQPLRKIASGGEMSRIMLALKGILAQSDRTSVLVFDEIDANVGGRLGSVIGSKLKGLARHHQVLCITHLPQIASFAERHLTVRKLVGAQSTASTVRRLEGDERLEELAEMIGGTRVTETTRAQARELMESAAGAGVVGGTTPHTADARIAADGAAPQEVVGRAGKQGKNARNDGHAGGEKPRRKAAKAKSRR